MVKIRKKENSLLDIINKSYNSLNINYLIKVLKNKQTTEIIDTLNIIDDAKAIIFAIIAAEQTRPLRLITSLNYEKQDLVFEYSSNSQLKKILKNLYPDQITNLLHEHEKYSKQIYLSIDKETRKEVNKIESYDDDEIGRIMNPNAMSLRASWSISKAINYVKSEYQDSEISSTLFVIDRNKKLIGVVTIHDLFFAKKANNKVINIVNTNVIKINHKDSIEDVINIFDKYGSTNLPVVNSKEVLIGFIRNVDISAAMQDETTEDIYNMYGITELRTPYLHSPIWKIARSRILWLTILMIMSTLTSFVLDSFQHLGDVLTMGISTTLLVPLLPVLTGTSGNAGSQASASIIRSLSIGEITKKEYWKAILKELQVGILIGLILAVINFVRLLIYYAILKGSNHDIFNSINPTTDYNWVYSRLTIIAATTSLTLFISIIISKLLGACLPILATKFKIDPTVMSAPILATILDVVTTTTLFGIGIGIISATIM